MLSHIRAIVVGASLLFVTGGLFACHAKAAEGSSSAAFASAAPALSPVLLAQYSDYSRSGGSSGGVRIPYGVIRLVVLGIMGAGGWLGSRLYR